MDPFETGIAEEDPANNGGPADDLFGGVGLTSKVHEDFDEEGNPVQTDDVFGASSQVYGDIGSADGEAVETEAVFDAVATGVSSAAVDYTVPSANIATLPPETGVRAEVIVITTSLGSSRRNFFGSRRAMHLLDCKGILYHVVDVNRDVTQSSQLRDTEFVDEWSQRGILLRSTSSDNQILLPQVLIDGVSIGDALALQDMEEDYDLDWAVRRAACPYCLNERDPTAATCEVCQTQFALLVPEESVERGEIRRVIRGTPLPPSLDAETRILHELRREMQRDLKLKGLAPGDFRSLLGEHFAMALMASPELFDDSNLTDDGTGPRLRLASVERSSEGEENNSVVTYESLFGEPPPADPA